MIAVAQSEIPYQAVHRWRAFAVLAVAYFMTIVDLTIVNVALPTIGRKLHFSETNLQWVVTAYGLTFGGFLLLGGRAADLFGGRRVFLAALTLFTLASLACGLATDDLALIGFAQAIPTLFPFVELQAKLVARYLGGDYALPSIPEMEETIRHDDSIHTADFSDRPRHTMEIEWYTYEHDIWTREIPAGRERAESGMAPKLAGRVLTGEAAGA